MIDATDTYLLVQNKGSNLLCLEANVAELDLTALASDQVTIERVHLFPALPNDLKDKDYAELERFTLTSGEVKMIRNDYEDTEMDHLYEIVMEDITGHDAEDGGCDYCAVIKRLSDGKYFSSEYTDWDVNYDSNDSQEIQWKEVTARTKTIIIYE
jgi:hypothetical protein